MDLQPALLSTRLAASLCTALLLIAAMLLLAVLARMMHLGHTASLIFIYVVPLTAIAVLGASHQATYGMKIMHLRFGLHDGRRIGFWRCLLRIALGAIFSPLLPLSLVIALKDPRLRTLPDLICRTSVWIEPQKPDPAQYHPLHVMPLEDRQHL